LDDAIERAIKIYEKENRHAAPTEVIAQDLGYKGANNGAALAVMASLRYYGLLERPRDGHLVVSGDVEAYKFAPSENLRRDLLVKWLKTPSLFADLLEKYHGGLPSDANIKFDLIKKGFYPATADAFISVFRKSVEFARYFESVPQFKTVGPINDSVVEISSETHDPKPALRSELSRESASTESTGHDRIPVRLSGNRRAWLEIPTPFFEADKERLKAQIDLVIVDEEEQSRK
jgi:hypothetical protein